MAAVLPRLPADAAVGLLAYGAASAAVYELASASTDLATADAFGSAAPDAADAARLRKRADRYLAPRHAAADALARCLTALEPVDDEEEAAPAAPRCTATALALALALHRATGAARGDVVLVGGAGAPAASPAALRALGDAACAASVCVHLVVGADARPPPPPSSARSCCRRRASSCAAPTTATPSPPRSRARSCAPPTAAAARPRSRRGRPPASLWRR